MFLTVEQEAPQQRCGLCVSQTLRLLAFAILLTTANVAFAQVGPPSITAQQRERLYRDIAHDIKYYVPNVGFVVKLWDFGKSLSVTHFKHTAEDLKVIESDDLEKLYTTETSLFGSDIHKISNIHQWVNTTYVIKNKEVLPKKIIDMLKNFQTHPKENVGTLLKTFMSQYLNNRIGTKIGRASCRERV